jgi:magnesium-transporting ATPase (P-type)
MTCPYNNPEPVYLENYILLYNLIFTSIPSIFLGWFDQNLDARDCIRYPFVYSQYGRNLKPYTFALFARYMFDGVFQAAASFFIPLYVYGEVSQKRA